MDLMYYASMGMGNSSDSITIDHFVYPIAPVPHDALEFTDEPADQTQGSPVQDGDIALDLDCLVYMLRHLVIREDALSMALTCRSLHPYAIAHFRYWNISLNEENADAIRDSLYSGGRPIRFQLARELSLQPTFSVGFVRSAKSTKAVALASDLLANAHNLESLKYSSLKALGAARQLLIAACEENQTLQKLHIFRAGAMDCKLLNTLQAPLSLLRLDILIPRFPLAQMELDFPDLARFASTLREVRVSMDSGFFRAPSAPCQNVHTLVLRGTSCVSLRILTKAFPNIRQLKYYVDPVRWRVDQRQVRDTLARANLRAQAKDPWPFLETVNTDISSCHVLNLRCQIRRLNIHRGYSEMCKKDLSWLVEYLDLIGPSTLSFTLLVLGRKCFRNIDAVKGHYMDLNNLIVDMTCFAFLARKEVPFKMLRAFGRLFPSMTHLVVRVRWADGFDNSFGAQFRQIWDHDSRWPAQGCPRYERKWMATLDERKFALRLAKCLLSIQFLVLEFSGKRRSYWQIERTDKGPCSTKLKSGLGEDILAARGL